MTDDLKPSVLSVAQFRAQLETNLEPPLLCRCPSCAGIKVNTMDWICARYAEARQASAWQPIETANTEDYAPVLLWTPHVMAIGVFDGGDWFILGGRGMVIEATHWQPLPDWPLAPLEERTENR